MPLQTLKQKEQTLYEVEKELLQYIITISTIQAKYLAEIENLFGMLSHTNKPMLRLLGVILW